MREASPCSVSRQADDDNDGDDDDHCVAYKALLLSMHRMMRFVLETMQRAAF